MMCNNLYYHFVRLCNWFAQYHYVIAYSTHCNPEVTRKLRNEWNYWRNELDVLEIQRMAK